LTKAEVHAQLRFLRADAIAPDGTILVGRLLGMLDMLMTRLGDEVAAERPIGEVAAANIFGGGQ
jgi:hypothetical protein